MVSSNTVAAERGLAANKGNEMAQQATRPACWTPETIKYIIATTAAAVGISSPRNTVYIFLLHYNHYFHCIYSSINYIPR